MLYAYHFDCVLNRTCDRTGITTANRTFPVSDANQPTCPSNGS